jgi:hypothetical protein
LERHRLPVIDGVASAGKLGDAFGHGAASGLTAI